MRPRRVVLAILLAIVAPQLGAQDSGQCDTYVDAIAKIARPVIVDTTRLPLFYRVSLCVGRGPAEIARLWSLPDLTDREYMELAWSSRFADVRLADTLIAIAQRRSLRPRARVLALFSLGHQISSRTPLGVDELQMIGRSDTNHYSTHGGGVPGGRPLTDADRQRVINLFADLSTQTDAPAVQHAARGALRVSAETYPRLTRVPSGTVTLSYVCGNRFRIVNLSPVSGEFDIEVDSTTERRSVHVTVSRSLDTPSESFFTTRARGTVRLSWQGELLQTKDNGGTSCPTRQR